MTTAFDQQVAAFDRQVQWLIEIDLDTCSRFYGTAPCTASGSDGSRCYYSYFTCQDPTHFTKSTRILRFCLADVPWPDPNYQVYPLLEKHPVNFQAVDVKKLWVYPETITLSFLACYDPPPLDHGKGSTHINSARAGEFWRNLTARNPNYVGRALRIYRGFNAPGFTYADFQKVGPNFKIHGFKADRNKITITARSVLADLDKTVIPRATSDDNTLQANITNSDTVIPVRDAYEYPDPTTLSRNKVYIQIESERMRVVSRSTATNQLTVDVRGALGTTAVAHTAADSSRKLDKKVSLVVLLGTDMEDGDPLPKTVTEVMQDLLEWCGIAAADVNDTSFDNVQNSFCSRPDVLAIITKSEKAAKHFQILRESRGLIIFMDQNGKFACSALLPSAAPVMELDDSNLVNQTPKSDTDEEERCTRVSIWYAPTVESSSRSQEYQQGNLVIDAELESDNFMDEVKDKYFLDPYLNPDEPPLHVRNLGRRIIRRCAFGTRRVRFQLELVNGSLWPGDAVLLTTKEVLDIYGEPKTLLVLIVSRKETSLHVFEYEGIDCENGGQRFCRIAADTITDDYDTASEAEKKWWFFNDSDQRVGAAKEPGYTLW